jgi:predicted HTH transcriptional regulator
MKKNNSISTNELIKATGLTRRQIVYKIRVLKQYGVIARRGAKKNGEWTVHQEDF